MKQAEKYNRRRFLLMGCGALCAAALGSGCAALQVADGTSTACPYGEVSDAYPGKCHRYVDLNQDGFCDLGGVEAASAAGEEESVDLAALPADTESDAGESMLAAPTEAEATVAVPTAAHAVVNVRCPHRLVNDPYPGRCHHYRDSNNSGFCDLSEAA